MQLIKPQAISVLHQPFTANEHHLCIAAIVMFRFADAGLEDVTLDHEAALWQLAAEELPNGIVDEVRPKPRAELVVDGFAYPAEGPAPACKPRASLGSVDKSLHVVGDRHWRLDGAASDATPFERMRLDWAHAFGGEAIGANHLPNVLRPGERLLSPHDVLTPAGLSARSFDHPERVRYAGTYNAEWQQTRAPFPPADYDVHAHMLAQPDQWLEGFLKGDERFFIEHMHPTKPRLEGRLPGLGMRCFVSRRGDGGGLEAVAMRLDTVRLIPHCERGLLVFRGMAPTAHDDGDDIKLLMLACERLHPRREAAHYEAEARRRLGGDSDSCGGNLQAWLDDAPLLPEGVTPPEPPGITPAAPGILAERLHTRAQQEFEDARNQLIAGGVDPDAYGIPKTLDEEPDSSAAHEPANVERAEAELAAIKQHADQAIEEAKTRAQQLCAEHGVSCDIATGNASPDAGRPPTFSATETLEALQAQLTLSQNTGVELASVAAWLNDPASMRAHLTTAEQQLVAAYRQFAHYGPPPEPRAGEPEERRALFETALFKRQPFSGCDFTCADLSGMDLRGVDLSGAFLAGALLRETNLTGAILDDTVLAFADLSGATLTNASMRRANLGGACLTKAHCNCAVLECAILDGAELTDATLHNAQLREATLDRATLKRTDFTGAQMEGIRAYVAQWDAAILKGATLNQATVLGFAARGAQLQGATLTRSCFTDTDLTDAAMTAATLDSCGFAGTTTLAGASFDRAQLRNLSFAGANLQGATFNEAACSHVDFTKANLTASSFYRARAPHCLWQRANLRETCLVSLYAPFALFQCAALQGADISGAMLHGADFTQAIRDKATCLGDAVTTRAQLSWRRQRNEHNDPNAGAKA